MSHGFALAYNPTLLTLLWFGTPLHAIAFHRARLGHALGAPRACVWHARAPEPPCPTPHSLRSVTDRSQHAVSPSAPHKPRSSRHLSGRPTTSRHCLPTAPALASAAQATSARQLALGAVAARPLAPAAIPSLATMPCSYRRRSSAPLSTAVAEPPRLAYLRKPEPAPHTGNLRPPQWRSPTSHSTRGGLLPHLRQPQPPPLPQPFQRHQGLPLSVLFTKRKITLPDGLRPPRSSPPAAPSTPETITTTRVAASIP